jgi:acetoin utilization protein AcuB
MRQFQVRDWMTANPVTITPKTTLPDAYKLMKEFRIRRLPVVEHGDLVGMVSWGDVREASASDASSLSVWELNYLLSKLTVESIMSKKIVAIGPNETIQDAARLMLQHKISGLPVVETGKIVGVVTESDIFRMIVQQWEQETKVS